MIINEKDDKKKKSSNKGRWVTMNGTHVLVDKNNNITNPSSLSHLSDKSSNNSDREITPVEKSGPSKFAQGLANAIESSEKWIENNVINNISNIRGTNK